MTKPRLPSEVESFFPPEVLRVLYGFVPHLPKQKPASPGLQKELERLQSTIKRNAMDLKGLDDFVLK